MASKMKRHCRLFPDTNWRGMHLLENLNGDWEAGLWSGFDRFAEPRRLQDFLDIHTEFEGFGLAIHGSRAAIAAPAHDADSLRTRVSDTVDVLTIGQSTLLDWILAKARPNSRIWIDHDGLPVRLARKLVERLEATGLVCSAQDRTDENDNEWSLDETLGQAALVDPNNRFGLLSTTVAERRLRVVCKHLSAQGVCQQVFSRSVVTSWMLGLRPTRLQDRRITPALLLLEAKGKGTLFTDMLPDQGAQSQLSDLGISIAKIAELPTEVIRASGPIHADLDVLSSKIASSIASRKTLSHADDPALVLLSHADDDEVEELRQAHLAMGCAFVEAIAEAEPLALAGKLSELGLAKIIDRHLHAASGFRGKAFSTIVAAGDRSAWAHPDPPATERRILKNDVVLIDMGIHTSRATTDMTRIIVFGRPKMEMRRVYTMLARSLAGVFLSPLATGEQLAAQVEKTISGAGYKLVHGLGHGVVPGLRVHAPMQLFGSDMTASVCPETIAAVEPGIYLRGQFGMRLENMLRATPAGESMELLTCAPLSAGMLIRDQIPAHEMEWIDNANSNSQAQLSPHLTPRAAAWLKRHVDLSA